MDGDGIRLDQPGAVPILVDRDGSVLAAQQGEQGQRLPPEPVEEEVGGGGRGTVRQ